MAVTSRQLNENGVHKYATKQNGGHKQAAKQNGGHKQATKQNGQLYKYFRKQSFKPYRTGQQTRAGL